MSAPQETIHLRHQQYLELWVLGVVAIWLGLGFDVIGLS